MIKKAFSVTYRAARKIVVFVIGITIVLVGVIMIVTPGPATVVIPAGLAVLAIEFAWARRWLTAIKEKGLKAANTVLRRKPETEDTSNDAGGV